MIEKMGEIKMADRENFKRLEMELKRDKDKIFTPWQIQDFIGKLASTYYKLDLINSISNKINKGVKKENIFIIDESFKYQNSYDFLKNSNKLNLNNEKDFKCFYHFGNPVSMNPDIKILSLNLKFNLFRDLNKCLGNKKVDKIDKASFHELMLTSGNEIGEGILNLAFENIKSIEKLKKERIEQDLIDIQRRYEREYEKYIKDEFLIDSFKSIINSENIDEEELEKYREIEEKYFKEFKKYFNKLERPIIGIYMPETNSVELLGASFINKKSRDERFLDIKEISHNSPPYCHLFMGLAFVTPTIILTKNIIEANSKKISNSSNQAKILELKEKNEKYNASLEQLEILIEEEHLEEYENISNGYTRNSVQDMHGQVIEKSIKNMKDCGFENSNLSSNIIYFDNYRNQGEK
jgi:hypothetical protein